MIKKKLMLSMVIILVSLGNIRGVTTPKYLTIKMQPQNAFSQLAESQNVYTFELVHIGSESPKMANARELMWNHYSNNIPIKMVFKFFTKEGEPVILIFTTQNNENNERVIKLEAGRIKNSIKNYEQTAEEDYEVTATGFYDQINPIKPPKYGLSPRKFLPKDNLPESWRYRLLLKSSTNDKEIVF